MNSVQPSILLIIPNLGRGGAQQVFRQQYNSLSLKYNVHGCVFNWDGTTPLDWPPGIISLEVPAGSNIVKKAYFFYSRIYRLKRLKKKLGVGIAISHLEGADYVNILSRQREKIILWIHGTKEHDANISGFLGWLRKSVLMSWLYKKATRIVTVSEGILQELISRYSNVEDKVLVIHNGIDLKKILNDSKESIEPEFLLLKKKFKIIITHCRLAAQKNLPAFISMINLVKDDQVKWVIIGDGELRDDLLDLSKSRNISTYNAWSGEPWDETKKLFFLGYKSNPYAYLVDAYLFLMTSSWEGFPLAICEAMACGLPVAATDCPTGPREILAPGKDQTLIPEIKDYGILLPILNSQIKIEEVGSYLETLTKQPALGKFAALSRKRVSEFSSTNFFKQQESLIQSLQ
jgi:glycosyltransferase involved in cell wall biosynthesis